MKKEIYCPKCKLRIVEIMEKNVLPPGEHVKYVDGTSLNVCICDFCNMQIFEGQACCCFTNYIDGQAPYEAWEHDHIRINDPEKPAPIHKKGVYGLLITGDDDQIMAFTISTSFVLNFLEKRMNTVIAMCMSESLELATGVAKKHNVTLQYIDHIDGAEVYRLIHRGTHALWQEGGYKEDGN